VDRIPVWARAGAVIAKIPEDVMTLVPQSESGNTKVKSLDNRRVVELIGGGEGETRITDFEGRAVVRGVKSLNISGGPAARMIVRWRFGAVTKVKANGIELKVQTGADGPSVEFDYAAESLVEWE
jgi:alpha-D-xyloside xylohydrolase